VSEPTGRIGRPRSESAREAVLHAVDDLLLEVGYAAMTMKGIAERAGVGRQTVYRWWATKAEILFEASVIDAQEELAINPTGDSLDDLTSYVEALVRFLTCSAAGAAYRALIGEAQHDHTVAELLRSHDLLGDGARCAIESAAPASTSRNRGLDDAAAQLVGPVFYWILTGHDPADLDARKIAAEFLSRSEPASRPGAGDRMPGRRARRR
jgi:AcrR family transcriptional regulator